MGGTLYRKSDTYNKLSEGWGDKKTFNDRAVFKKLVDITGENKLVKELYLKRDGPRPNEFGNIISTRGGKASAWYHFFGAAAAAYDQGTEDSKNLNFLPCSIAAANASLMGRVAAGSLIAIENATDQYVRRIVGKRMNDLLKRKNINSQGVIFGAELSKNMVVVNRHAGCAGFAMTNLPPYLSDRPDIYGKKWKLRAGEMPYEY